MDEINIEDICIKSPNAEHRKVKGEKCCYCGIKMIIKEIRVWRLMRARRWVVRVENRKVFK